MVVNYRIDYDLIDFSCNDDKKQYLAVFMVEEIYGRLVMNAFYLPRHSISRIRDCHLRNKTVENQFTAYRELSSNIVCCEYGRKITSFIVEEVTHPSQLASIAQAYLSYQRAPKGRFN